MSKIKDTIIEEQDTGVDVYGTKAIIEDNTIHFIGFSGLKISGSDKREESWQERQVGDIQEDNHFSPNPFED